MSPGDSCSHTEVPGAGSWDLQGEASSRAFVYTAHAFEIGQEAAHCTNTRAVYTLMSQGEKNPGAGWWVVLSWG